MYFMGENHQPIQVRKSTYNMLKERAQKNDRSITAELERALKATPDQGAKFLLKASHEKIYLQGLRDLLEECKERIEDDYGHSQFINSSPKYVDDPEAIKALDRDGKVAVFSNEIIEAAYGAILERLNRQDKKEIKVKT